MIAYANCKWCYGQGCLVCQSERKKAEAFEAKYEAERKARLAQKSPQDILAALPGASVAVEIAAGIKGVQLDKDEIECMARSQVLKNLEDGGHEYPMPEPIFTCDRSDTQFSEMAQVFHIDKLKEALAPGGIGMQGIVLEAQEVMQRRAKSDAWKAALSKARSECGDFDSLPI